MRELLRKAYRRVSGRSPSTRKRLNRQADRLDRQAKRLEDIEKRLGQLGRQVNGARTTAQVVEHQLAALEARFADVADAARPLGPVSEADQAEARDLLTEVRAEHARIRARFQVIASYEERLRRLEEAAAAAAETRERRPDRGPLLRRP